MKFTFDHYKPYPFVISVMKAVMVVEFHRILLAVSELNPISETAYKGQSKIAVNKSA